MLTSAGKRVLLTVHLIVNAVWIGGVALMLFINGTKDEALSSVELASIDEMIFRIHDVIVMNVGFVVIVTALCFSLFTKWGFFDFPWVIVKWLCLVMLFVVITFLQAPAVNGMAALSDIGGLNALGNPEYLQYQSDVTLYSLALMMLLSLIIGLSVFKPWGPRKKPFRTRRRVVLTIGTIVGLLTVGVSVFQFQSLQAYRDLAVQDVDLSAVPDGTFEGTARLGAAYSVEVTTQRQRIASVRILRSTSNHYARLAEGIIHRVIAEQSLQVRAITGATTSSKGLLRATETALLAASMK